MRIRIIQILISILENVFFYPKLKSFYRGVALLNHPAVILDIGANKGQSIDFFLRLYPQSQIFAFEPNKSLNSQLNKKYQDNQNIVISSLGVSDIVGTLTFNVNAMDETSTLEKINTNSIYLNKKAKVLGVKKENIIVNKYEVEVSTLNKIFKIKSIKSVDILKIDVEGHEYQVLNGLFAANSTIYPKYIQLESHLDDMYIDNPSATEIENLLSENGYVKIKTLKHPFGEFNELIYMHRI